tara:strand:- start:84 stop:371 length:288 start_codon:yes stop_codon:yes gene_type:complete
MMIIPGAEETTQEAVMRSNIKRLESAALRARVLKLESSSTSHSVSQRLQVQLNALKKERVELEAARVIAEAAHEKAVRRVCITRCTSYYKSLVYI